MYFRPVRTSQPQGPARVDWSNPITWGLVVAFAPSVSGNNLIDGDPTKANATANKFGAKGKSSTFTGLVSTSASLASTNWSFLTHFKTAESLGAQESILGRSTFGANNKGFGFNSTHAAPTYDGAIYAGNSYTVIGKPTGGALAANTEYCIAGTYDGTNGRGFSNGARTVGPTAVGSINLGERFAINANSDGGVDVGSAQVYITLVFNRALSDAEVKSLSDNPWQIFAPDSKALWVPAAVSVTLPTLVQPNSTTSAGAWTATGAASLHAAINETVASDIQYISVNSASTTELLLAEAAYPGATNQTLAYRASSTQGSTLTVTLKQGVTTIMTRTHALTGTDTLYTQTLTSGEIALITAGAISVTLTTS